MSNEIAEVARAKSDLEAVGQQWNTSCDAYRITNLAAYRNGWKVVQKTQGDNCQGRKVDGIIKDGILYDCLTNAGPPVNANTPSWGYVGPQAALVALDPVPDLVQQNPNPEPPVINDMTEKLDQIIASQSHIIDVLSNHSYLLDQIRIQADNNTNAIINTDNANTEKIQQQLHQIVENMEESLKKALALILANRSDIVNRESSDSEVFDKEVKEEFEKIKEKKKKK